MSMVGVWRVGVQVLIGFVSMPMRVMFARRISVFVRVLMVWLIVTVPVLMLNSQMLVNVCMFLGEKQGNPDHHERYR